MFYLLHYTESMDLKTVIVWLHQQIILITNKCWLSKVWNQNHLKNDLRYWDTRVKGWKFKLYSMSTRLHVNNHLCFYFYFNILTMMSFGNIQCYLATTDNKPCFALYVIHLFVQGVFSMFLVLMYSAEWALVCYVYIFYIFSAIFL